MQPSNPLVSVIIPAFNCAGTIVTTIESVLKQSYNPIEIIVVDDGSTDNTATIVQSLAETHASISLIRKPNEGVASARNAGIEAAQGDLIAPIDSDDLWHASKIAKQVQAFQQAP